MVAIELTLKWKKGGGVYSITSTGQYVPLIIEVASFISVRWSLMQQEVVSVPLRKSHFSFADRVEERRRNLRRSQDINQDEDGIELDSSSHTLASAINHAFTQPDINSKNRTLIRLN
jgi:hypothetical protein